MNVTRDSAPSPGRMPTLCGLLMLVFIVYLPATLALVGFWTDSVNVSGTHGFLIFGMSAWALFRRRRVIAEAPASRDRTAAILLFASSVAWVVLWRASIQDGQLLLLPVLLWLAVCSVFGRQIGRLTAFALAFLYFAMPAWGSLTAVLQEFTIRAVHGLAHLCSLPAQFDGDRVAVHGGTFEIAPGCSGEHFLVVGLALATLYGEIEGASVRRRIALIGLMGALAIVCNWIRVFAIILIGYLTSMHNPLVTDGHLMFGWVLFLGAVVLFVCSVGARKVSNASHMVKVKVQPLTLPVSLPFKSVTALLVLAPASVYAVAAFHDARMPELTLALPQGRLGWGGPVVLRDGDWSPAFSGPHAKWHARYEDRGGQAVELIVIGYRVQTQGVELVNEGNSLLGRSLTATSERLVAVRERRYQEVLASDSDGRHSVIWSVYDVGGRGFAWPLAEQLWYGARSLGGAPPSFLFAFRSLCERSCDGARTTLERFSDAFAADLFGAAGHSLGPE